MCILSLMSCVIPTAAYLMVGHCHHFSTSNHKVVYAPSPLYFDLGISGFAGLLLFHMLMTEMTLDGMDRIERGNTRYSAAPNT